MAGIRGFFFSDVASAVRRAAFEAVGGFPNRVPTNEDMLLCARLLAGGWSVRYAAEAQVYHSHNFSCADLARRYYRIGVFLALHGSSLASGSVSGEGLRFMWEQLRYLSGTGAWCWIPRSVVDCAVKYAGFRLGFRSGLREAAMAAQSSPGVRP
jgi:rhamnosyltransferase